MTWDWTRRNFEHRKRARWVLLEAALREHPDPLDIARTNIQRWQAQGTSR